MNPGLLNPWGLVALGSLAVVGVIYLFYQRYKKKIVTGLFLWEAPPGFHEGGRKLAPIRITRSLLLDLLACALLALAVAAPALLTRTGKTVVIILDGSLSMRASANHEKARKQAHSIVSSPGQTPSFILLEAGDNPRVLAGLNSDRATIERAIAAYDPHDPSDSVDEAIRLARELVTGQVDVQVITDHLPRISPPAATTLTVHQLAGRAPNPAIVDATMEADGTVTLAVAAFSPKRLQVRLEILDDKAPIHVQDLDLTPSSIRQLKLAPQSKGPLQVRLVSATDAIAEDSRALLIAEPPATVSYGIALEDPDGAIERALRAAGAAEAPGAPDLLVTSGTEQRGKVATLVLPSTADGSSALLGPFVIDLAHPLCRDLDLTGVYWTAGSDPIQSAGVPLVMVGDRPLYLATDDGSLLLDLLPSASNVIRTAAWPVIISNTVTHTRQMLPGLRRTNYRPGEVPVFVHADPGQDPVAIVGHALQIPWSRHAPPPRLPSRPGRYEVRLANGSRTALAVNSIAPAESDLSQLSAKTATRTIGKTGLSAGALTASPLTWILVALALLAIAANWFLDRRNG